VFSVGRLNGSFLINLAREDYSFAEGFAAWTLEAYANLKGGSSLSSSATPSDPTSIVG